MSFFISGIPFPCSYPICFCPDNLNPATFKIFVFRIDSLRITWKMQCRVVNFLARRGTLEPGSELFGKAFENWVFHELCCFNSYRERFAEFSFWRLSSGIEVDFVINDLECVIECKASSRVHSTHLKGLREIAREHPSVGRRMLVCNESSSRKTNDGIEILTVRDFLDQLWGGCLF